MDRSRWELRIREDLGDHPSTDQGMAAEEIASGFPDGGHQPLAIVNRRPVADLLHDLTLWCPRELPGAGPA